MKIQLFSSTFTVLVTAVCGTSKQLKTLQFISFNLMLIFDFIATNQQIRFLNQYR